MEKAKKAYEDLDFLRSREARHIRILCEYHEPLKRFDDNNIKHTVVFFGSARIKDNAKQSPKSYQYYLAAEELAFRLSKWSQENLRALDKELYICTGGGPGIMEAANRGANRADSKTIGLNICLPFEQHPNPYISPELNFEFNYFFMRKLWFLYTAKAVVAFPGGFGTFDELFETLTLVQTKKFDKKKFPIILFGKEYWESIINFEKLVEMDFIEPQDVEMFKIVSTVDEAFDYLTPVLKNVIDSIEEII